MNIALNFVAFQVGWFACVLGAAHGLPWLGPLVVLGVVVAHLQRARRPIEELRLVLCAMLLGLVVDSLLLASGWVRYPSGLWLPGLAPYWIVAMWALFATTLNLSLRWLKFRALLAGLLGAIGGPLSYVAGERLGGIELAEPALALTSLAVAWSLAMPALTRLALRYDGITARPMPGYLQQDWRLSGHG